MAKRSLEELQKRYASAAAMTMKGPGMGGPGGGRGGRGRNPGLTGKPKNQKATVRRLLSYIAAYRMRLIAVLVFMLLNTLSSISAGYFLRDVINVVDKDVPPEKSLLVRLFMPEATAETFGVPERIGCLGIILLVMACVYAVGIVTSYFQGRLMLTVSQNATEKLRNDLYGRLQRLPVRYFDSNTTGELMSRFTNDIDTIDMMINNTVVSLVSGVISLVGTLVMMIWTNIWLTLITIAFVPLFSWLGGVIAKASGKYYKAQQSALGAVNGYIEETVTGAKVVKVFNHEETCVEEFDSLNDDMRD